jgi:large subunit ribosomal protein L7/L12
MSDIQQLEDLIAGLSLLDAAELVRRLESRLGVSAKPSTFENDMKMAVQPVVAEEQTEFTVVMTAVGPTKINVIKAVREVTSLGLKEAKELVDGVPKNIKEGVSKSEADTLAKKFRDVGAIVEIK